MTEADGGSFFLTCFFEYLSGGGYPDGFDKNDRHDLRKRVNFLP